MLISTPFYLKTFCKDIKNKIIQFIELYPLNSKNSSTGLKARLESRISVDMDNFLPVKIFVKTCSTKVVQLIEIYRLISKKVHGPQGSPGKCNSCRYRYIFTGKHFLKTYRTKVVQFLSPVDSFQKITLSYANCRRSKIRRKTLVARNEIVSSYYYSDFSLGFRTANFSETVRSFFMKLSGVINIY